MSVDPTRSTAAPPLARLVAIWLVVILLFKWSALSEPPVWDAAFGLFPAASELANNQFDLPNLLHQPTYMDGGPNCHAESLVTWITAVVLWGLGTTSQAYVVLHLLHFGAAAWTLAVLHQLTTKLMGPRLGWMLSGMLLLCPLFRVQIGAMYLEIPLAACAISAVAAYADGKVGRALVWSTLAVMVKQTGLIVAGTLAVSAFVRSGPIKKRLGLAISYAGLGLVVAMGPVVFTPVLEAASNSKPPASWWEYMKQNHNAYLAAVPDVAIGSLLLVVVGVIRLRQTWQSLNAGAVSGALATDNSVDTESLSDRAVPPVAVGVVVVLTAMFGLFFFVAPYLAHLDFYCLPRYFVAILPCVCLGAAYWLTILTSPRAAMLVLLVGAVLFVANRDGAWYPVDASNNLAIHERSESYRHIVSAQREILQAASNLPDDAVIFYGLPEHYFLKYPWLGYATRKHPGGRCVFLPTECPDSPKPKDLPERFFVILDAPFLGDQELQLVLRLASKDPSRQVRLWRKAQRGPFSVSLVEVSPKSSSRSSEGETQAAAN